MLTFASIYFTIVDVGAHSDSISILTQGWRVLPCQGQITGHLAKGVVTRHFVSQDQITVLLRAQLLDVLRIKGVTTIVHSLFLGKEVFCPPLLLWV